MYVHAKCTCKILNGAKEKRQRTRLQLYKHYSTQQMLLLWLEKTMLTPTCTISSLLILTITVRRTRWSVGRGVLRVVTQAYQGDEETRLTEPRYCWPTTLYSFPLTELTEPCDYTHLLGLHYACCGIIAQLHLEVKTKWSVSV